MTAAPREPRTDVQNLPALPSASRGAMGVP